jgi:long-subunit fatty acid transport protein
MTPLRKHALILAVAAVVLPASLSAQTIEDALRLSRQGTIVGARSAAMGNAFTGLANDYSALYWNPAGLGQLRRSELAVGMMTVSNTTDATLLGSSMSMDESATKLTEIGLALPFQVVRGSLVFGASYNRLGDYTNSYTVSAYNPYSSIQPSLFNSDADYDLAWQLGLEDTLLFTYRDQGKPEWLAIPVADHVQQNIAVSEEGGLNQWSFGGATEIAHNAMVGISLNFMSGTYRYQRRFEELDVQNTHQQTIVGVNPNSNSSFVSRTDFQSAVINETIDQDLTGFSMKFGFLYNHQDKLRAGVAIQTPRWMHVEEDYTKGGTSQFADAAEIFEYTLMGTIYDISTPWIFSFGLSYAPVEPLVLSADLDIVDYGSMEFDGSNYFMPTPLNNDIHEYFRSANNFRVGAEFNVPRTELFIRGGYGYALSAYQDDPSNYNAQTFSGGLGYEFNGDFMLNATYVLSSWDSFIYNYTDPDVSVSKTAYRTDQSFTNSQLLFSATYRF